MDRVIATLLMLIFTPYTEAEGGIVASNGASVRDLDGREVYVQSCAMCHTNGVGGAPRPGRPEDWVGRNRHSTAELLVSVLRGKGGMPPKGGNASLTRAEAYVALDYMLNGAK